MSNPNLQNDKEALTSADKEFENNIRPRDMDDFSGQPQIIENLSIFIKAAKIRGEALDHTLFHGPPGLGKTTLSRIIANEMGVNIKETSGPVIEKPGDLAGLLTSLEPKDVLFIDEIHTLIGAGSASGGTLDASNLLKPALSSGQLKCIGATTFTEYRGIFEKDHALSRRFQKIDVSEPTVEQTIEILRGLKSRFEDHHGVKYSSAAISAASLPPAFRCLRPPPAGSGSAPA